MDFKQDDWMRLCDDWHALGERYIELAMRLHPDRSRQELIAGTRGLSDAGKADLRAMLIEAKKDDPFAVSAALDERRSA